MDLEDINLKLDDHTKANNIVQEEIRRKVDNIMTNHLPHIEIAITKLDDRMKLILWLLSAATIAFIGSLFVKQ